MTFKANCFMGVFPSLICKFSVIPTLNRTENESTKISSAQNYDFVLCSGHFVLPYSSNQCSNINFVYVVLENKVFSLL